MGGVNLPNQDVCELAAIKERLARGVLRGALPATQRVCEKVFACERLTLSDGLALYSEPNTTLLGLLATWVRVVLNGKAAYYNRNGHIEPTNLCRYRCSFCSFRQEVESPRAWELGIEEIGDRAAALQASGATEVHITGGVHPSWTLADLERLVGVVRRRGPDLHIKAFSAIELFPLFVEAGVSIEEGLGRLQRAGLQSLPGGGAEIFNPRVREMICPEKGTGEEWLAVHRVAHRLGMPSNCTMLFGHVEGAGDRLEHLIELRALQDETHGFNCFIPLKYRARGNALGVKGEVDTVEVLRTFAISRLMLDNIQHLKVYWPMLGKEKVGLALSFGADDIDGTIGDSTRIYSMAGAEEQRPCATVAELEQLVRAEGYEPQERDSLYRAI